MNKKNEITEFEKDTENVLTTTLTGLAEGLTGLATSSRKELIISISHTFQRMRGGQFLSLLIEEWNKYREKGKVKEDYQYSEQHKVCLQELLDFLDNDSPDEIRFNVLKQIFLVAASEEISDRESIMPQQYMKIARSLSDGEIILLQANWQLSEESEWDRKSPASAHNWFLAVVEFSEIRYPELLEIYEKELIDKGLLSKRQHSDNSGIILTSHYRLTNLGYDLCRFIMNYEE